LFPYLHGLYNSSQRSFFGDGEDPSHLLPTLTKDFFNLMFLNVSSESGSRPDLINTVDLSELLVNDYEMFENICLSSNTSNELNNRNFKDQIKLMASVSSFVIYNYDNLDTSSIAELIDSLKGNSNLIFVMYDNKMIRLMKQIDLDDSKLENFKASSCTNSKGKEVAKNSKLLNYEQNLIWRLNSMKWIMNEKVCLGNIIDFNNLSNKSDDQLDSRSQNDFKLIINCHENAHFPSLSLLETIFDDLKSPVNDNSSHAYYLEFPSSGSFNPDKINSLEILSFLNVLKLIYLLVENFDEKVFIYSFDGFTGLSLLTICVEQLFKSETIEDSIVSLLSDSSKNTKLYYFKTDLIFLKQFERLVNYLKHHSLEDLDFVFGLDFQDVNTFHYQYIQQKAIIKYDWFNLQNDNNFPSRILLDLYLGSLNHANSITVLNSLNISRLISIGECPYWNITIIKPIYEFNDGEAKIYEVNFNDFPNRTRSKHVPKCLESLIFIHNLKDDGKDSFLELLIQCPEDIQSKVLLGSITSETNQNGNQKQSPVSLIHCRIGVSRSASIVVASLMKKFRTNLLTCYMYLRVQRFNIIIQPNLRLFHELYMYEEFLGLRNEHNRGYNWEVLCNEIFKLNNHYI
ncbi:phosphatases II, partial [Suhomyces tanzawaensis NRRL Y-17324]